MAAKARKPEFFGNKLAVPINLGIEFAANQSQAHRVLGLNYK